MDNMTKKQLIAEVEALEADLRLAKAELWESLGERDRLRADYIKRDVWVPACGGKETPFRSRTGAMLTYMWNQTTGEHAYYNHDTDTFLSYADALELM